MRSAKTCAPTVPEPLTLRRALDDNASLASLGARLAESQRRFDAVASLLPAGLVRDMRPGPIDDEGWSVLVSNAAVAAKLRHLLPRLDEALTARSFRALPIRVRVRSP
jgi:hypothetical protein